MAAIKKIDTLKVPEGVTVSVEGSKLKVSGKKGEVSRDFYNPSLMVKADGGVITIEKKKTSKREKKLVETMKAHIRNMFTGVKEGYVYKLKICSGHFPMNVAASGTTLTIKNFLGEAKARTMSFSKDVKLTIAGQDITIEGINLELVSQTAANIERLTKVKGRDRRIFQDGIYITHKAGEALSERQ